MTQPLPERALPRMLALTLWPEWAWAITHLDKRVENRSPAFAAQIARRVGDGWLAIHAGKSIGGRPGKGATKNGLFGVKNMALRTIWDCYSYPGTFGFVPQDDLRAPQVTLTADTVSTSAIVALARIGEVLPPGVKAPWKVTESAAIQLSDVVVLPEPIRCKGAQGLWTVPTEIEDQIRTILQA